MIETDKEQQTRIYPIILSEYSPTWPNWYEEEKENLMRLIGEENIARFSHFGSTSVPGLAIEPTADISAFTSERAAKTTLKQLMKC